jgi:hypothetical protein
MTFAQPSLKDKACSHCAEQFTPARPLQRVCSIRCAKRVAEAKHKAEKEDIKQRKEALKRPSEWEQDCLKIVQKIARLRDRHDGCISCHMPENYGGAWHGSHFRPAGNNSAVMFNLWNIHKSCAQCNLFKGGNIASYRPRLVEKIGAERVEWLESQTQVVKRNVDYLKRLKAVMGKRLRRLEKRIK